MISSIPMSKRECESYQKFPISFFKKPLKVQGRFSFHEYIKEGNIDLYFLKHENNKIIEMCAYQNDRLIFYREFKIVSTKPNYGGERYWFLCQNQKLNENSKCFRRVGTLYFDGINFGCRHCMNLTYQSQKKSRKPMSLIADELFGLDKKYRKIYNSTVKSHYKGKLTKKIKQLRKIERRMKQLEPICLNYHDDVMSGKITKW